MIHCGDHSYGGVFFSCFDCGKLAFIHLPLKVVRETYKEPFKSYLRCKRLKFEIPFTTLSADILIRLLEQKCRPTAVLCHKSTLIKNPYIKLFSTLPSSNSTTSLSSVERLENITGLVFRK